MKRKAGLILALIMLIGVITALPSAIAAGPMQISGTAGTSDATDITSVTGTPYGPGWYFTHWEFIQNPMDITIRGAIESGVIGTVDSIYDYHEGTGEKNNFKTAHWRTYEDGSLVASRSSENIWSDPPAYFSGTDCPSFTLDRTIGEAWGAGSFNAGFDRAEVKPGFATSGALSFLTEGGKSHVSGDYQGTFQLQNASKGYAGLQHAITISMSGYSFKYYYEWREGSAETTTEVSDTTKPGPNNAVDIVLTGGTAKDTTKVMNGVTGPSVVFKATGAIGYRIYRSEVKGELGISVTDFYITSTSFTDVNAEPNTTYYYTLKEVLAEADPFNDVREKEGAVLATWIITTSEEVGRGFEKGATKYFIMLKIDDPMMSVNGLEEEVDPGRGTTPVIIRNRTMVPIRAIVEAMGGEVGWTAATREVKISANNNIVEMRIDVKDYKINGVPNKLDVPPEITNERTFVPLRFSAENLNCQVDWLNSTRSVVIVWTY